MLRLVKLKKFSIAFVIFAVFSSHTSFAEGTSTINDPEGKTALACSSDYPLNYEAKCDPSKVSEKVQK